MWTAWQLELTIALLKFVIYRRKKDASQNMLSLSQFFYLF